MIFTEVNGYQPYNYTFDYWFDYDDFIFSNSKKFQISSNVLKSDVLTKMFLSSMHFRNMIIYDEIVV